MPARRLLGLCLLVSVTVIAGYRTTRIAAAVATPSILQSQFATYVAGPLQVNGANLGSGAAIRTITFSYDGGTLALAPSSPAITGWTDSAIAITLPPDVHSGSLQVTVDGAASVAVPLEVYEYMAFPVPATPGRIAYPLALDVAQDGNIWINEEAHTEIKSLSSADQPVGRVVAIPQTSPPGIFAARTDGGFVRAPVSVTGEDMYADPDGSVWFTEGGDYLYDGPFPNSSRIVNFRPADNSFRCYNVPDDNAEVNGLVVDHVRRIVWYTESSLGASGNAIGGLRLSDAISDCAWTPDSGTRTPVCAQVPTAGCHLRIPLPQPASSPMKITQDAAGNLWITEYWGTRIAKLNPDTSTFTEFPLPPAIVRVGPGLWAGSGPWDIKLDGNGDVWIAEEFDGTISRLRPSRAATADCTRLDTRQMNPCVDELYVGSDGYNGISAHSLTITRDARVWFVLIDNVQHTSRVGFVNPSLNDAVTLLPVMNSVQNLSGIVQNSATGDIWFGEFSDRRLGRIRLAAGDADGVPDASDNCPTVYNPGQENADRNFTSNHPVYAIDDRTNPRSDNIGDACDADTDNDGIPNVVETNLVTLRGTCSSASRPLDPMSLDTDGDRVTDGAECALGSDPASAQSKPATPPAAQDTDGDGLPNAFEISIGTDPAKKDTDGDGLQDGWEVKGWGTNPLNSDTDADGAPDACEVASVNPDMLVTPVDQAIVAAEILRAVPATQKLIGFDQNKDGQLNPGDQAFQAGVIRSARCRLVTPWP